MFGRAQPAHTDEMSFVVDDGCLSIDDIRDFRAVVVRQHRVHDALQCVVFMQAVTGVEETDIVACRQSQAFVHGVIQPFVRFADDRVDVYAKDEETLWGEPAEILRHLLEIRGVGIIDVMSLYGASAVRNSSQVQLAIYLENFEDGKVFDRLGNGNEEIELQGVKIPRVRIPVKTGRNVSVVIEAAAMNYRAKQMGFDATKTFEERLTNLISKNGED